jgi:phosphoadenosine phosphosulfate reductase
LWEELEAADAAHLLNTVRLSRSLSAIREFAQRGRCYCAVSWGKDSIVVAYLCRLVDPKIPLHHLRPSNHNPDCDAVRDAYFKAFPGQIYFETVIDYGKIHAANLPDHEHDIQTNALWWSAIRDASERIGKFRILGIRAAESAGRNIRCQIWNESSPNACAPIAWWTTQDVFAFLCQHDLPVHPAYACLGAGRWDREYLRVSEIGDSRGRAMGRDSWEMEYYPEQIRKQLAHLHK